VNPITDEVAARLVGANYSNDKPPRLLSPPGRSATYESYGDEALVRCRAIARVAVSFPWRSTHADVSYQRNTSMSGPSASQKRANRAGR
jgi:hypothetical protein